MTHPKTHPTIKTQPIMKKLVPLAMLAAAAGLTAGSGRTARAQEAVTAPARPRLVVVVSVDQLRADYLTRFADLYLPPRDGDRVGGFRYLMERGAWYPDCRYTHYRTVTAVGHSILGTGAQPFVSGIVGNDWFVRSTGKGTYCVDDPKSAVVGAQSGSKETPMSPANQLVTTVGDELEGATGGQAKTVALSLKDRAAILMAGHRGDTVLWFDEETGGWVSSTYYFKDNKLPRWVEEFNDRKLADSLRQTPWTPAVDEAAFRRVWKLKPGTPVFSHSRNGRGYGGFTSSPAGNAFIFEAAQAAVEAEELGRDQIPDILSLNLASNDYVGHRFGPDSPEVLDISVQTDRQFSQFLNFLDKKVPGGLKNVTFAVSADHGVVPVPELSSECGIPASRAIASNIRGAAEKALDEQVGAADWIASTANGEIYFSDKALAQFPREPRERLEGIVAAAVRTVPGVYLALGKTAIMSGRVPNNVIGRRVTEGVHPDRSGDVVVLLNPQWLAGAAPIGTGTSHGSPFTYDTHVPLLVAGFGVRPGAYSAPVNPAQLAPSLSHILRVARPSGADEPLLPGLAGLKDER